jgi:HNH endonuclease
MHLKFTLLPPLDALWARYTFDVKRRLVYRTNPRFNLKINPGDLVGSVNGQGYLVASFMPYGGNFMVHRMVWKMWTGEEPGELDHEDRNRLNNDFFNLREATPVQNAGNYSTPRHNTSGLKGASFMPGGKWKAQIKINNKVTYLGSFETKEAAHGAYIKAAKEHFGVFASDGKRDDA